MALREPRGVGTVAETVSVRIRAKSLRFGRGVFREPTGGGMVADTVTVRIQTMAL